MDATGTNHFYFATVNNTLLFHCCCLEQCIVLRLYSLHIYIVSGNRKQFHIDSKGMFEQRGYKPKKGWKIEKKERVYPYKSAH